MSSVPFQKPIEDSVPKINDEVAIGEDLQFQRRWWAFERAMWWIIAVILLLNLAGAFGRGPLSHAQISNEAMLIKYERIERMGTPAILQVQLKAGHAVEGKINLTVSESIVDELGAQRVIPAPLDSVIRNGGLLYTFPVENDPGNDQGSVQLALQPARPGVFSFTMQVPGSSAITARIVVMP